MFAPAYEAGRNDRAFDRLNGTDRQMLSDIQVYCTDLCLRMCYNLFLDFGGTAESLFNGSMQPPLVSPPNK